MKVYIYRQNISACSLCPNGYTAYTDKIHYYCRGHQGERADKSTIPSWCPLPTADEQDADSRRLDLLQRALTDGVNGKGGRPCLNIWLDDTLQVGIADEDTDGETYSGHGKDLREAIDDGFKGED